MMENDMVCIDSRDRHFFIKVRNNSIHTCIFFPKNLCQSPYMNYAGKQSIASPRTQRPSPTA